MIDLFGAKQEIERKEKTLAFEPICKENIQPNGRFQ